MNDIMLDLETLALSSDALILSIGAAFFDKEEVGHSFYLVLDREDQRQANRKTDEKTAQWWSEQAPKARSVFDAPQTPVSNALNCFAQFIEIYATGNPKDIKVWGNGAEFDNALLASLYRDWGIKQPWPYNGSRCYRTLKNLSIPFGADDMPEREGTYHNALDDAVYQAACAGRYLKGTLK